MGSGGSVIPSPVPTHFMQPYRIWWVFLQEICKKFPAENLQKLKGTTALSLNLPLPRVSTPLQAKHETADAFKMRYALHVLSVCFFVHSLYSLYTCTLYIRGRSQRFRGLGPRFPERNILSFRDCLYGQYPSVLSPTLYLQFYQLMQHTIVVLVHKTSFFPILF